MASILKLLQTVDPRTRHYIRYYKISEIYEVFFLPVYLFIMILNRVSTIFLFILRV